MQKVYGEATERFIYFVYINIDKTGHFLTIRRIAVRETSVSRHHVGPIMTPLKLPVPHRNIVLRVLGALK